MASLVLKMSVSLDGYVAPADGSTDWVAAGRSDDGAQLDGRDREQRRRAPHRCRHLRGVGRLLARRLRAVRQADERDPQGRVLRLARVRRLGRDDDRPGDLAAAVTRLKQERPDGYLLAQGGARFARSLVQTGLIDEYRLVVHPVILGAGERLFTAPLTIEPVSTTAFSRGAVAHVFAAHP